MTAKSGYVQPPGLSLKLAKVIRKEVLGEVDHENWLSSTWISSLTHWRDKIQQAHL
jgi:hypothetical protein